MIINTKNESKNSIFRETIDALREINQNFIDKSKLRIQTANGIDPRNNLVEVGAQLINYSLQLKSLKFAKPTKLPIAGS